MGHPHGRQARRAMNLRNKQATKNLPDYRVMNAIRRKDGAFHGPETMPKRLRTRGAQMRKALQEWD